MSHGDGVRLGAYFRQGIGGGSRLGLPLTGTGPTKGGVHYSKILCEEGPMGGEKCFPIFLGKGEKTEIWGGKKGGDITPWGLKKRGLETPIKVGDTWLCGNLSTGRPHRVVVKGDPTQRGGAFNNRATGILPTAEEQLN